MTCTRSPERYRRELMAHSAVERNWKTVELKEAACDQWRSKHRRGQMGHLAGRNWRHDRTLNVEEAAGNKTRNRSDR